MNPELPLQDVGPGDATPRWVIAILVAIPTTLTLFVMLGVVASGTGAAALQFPSLLVENTPTGGETGAHVLMPQVIRDVLLPSGLISGWSDAWFAGFPALYFYFPLPMMTAALLGYALPTGVALKIVASAGVVAMPTVTYWCVRWMGLPRVVAAVSASGGAAFVFMESYGIFGGNIKSTLAGEFSFSWSLALGVLYLGLIARETRGPGRFMIWPGVVLALATLSHVVTTAVVVAVTVPWLFRRQSVRTVAGSWALGFGLTAFWSVPFAIRTPLIGLITDMRWVPVNGLIGSEGLIPADLILALLLGLIGLVWCVVRRIDVGLLIGLAVVPLAGYLILPLLSIHVVNNGRLLPYWYYAVFVFAGIFAGLGAGFLGRLRSGSASATLRYSLVVAAVVTLATMASVRYVTHWVDWSFSGYEGKSQFEDYAGLMRAVDELPPGRIAWEENDEIGRYGTPLALMLLPHWSEEHPSMSGLYQESSLTTPFNEINAAEIGLESSERITGLRYSSMDFERGIAHLLVYGVSYYVSFTSEAESAARAAGLEPLAVAPPWVVFGLPPSDLVDVASFTPSVWSGESGFVDASLSWYDDLDHLDRWLAYDGPAEWPRVSSLEDRMSAAPAIESSGTVSDIVIDNGHISFSTTAVGIPHFVKVSYFPNRTAQGAAGPYRTAPSVMVVAPTSQDVVLQFSRGSAEYAGMVLTGVTLALLVVWGLVGYRNRRSEANGQ